LKKKLWEDENDKIDNVVYSANIDKYEGDDEEVDVD